MGTHRGGQPQDRQGSSDGRGDAWQWAPRRLPTAPRPEAARGEPSDDATWRNRLLRLGDVSDGVKSSASPARHSVDMVEAFRPAILAIRWGTTVVSLALAADAISQRDGRVTAWALGILAYTAFRTWRPIRYTADLRSLISVLVEVTPLVLAVTVTGYWESPFVFSLLNAVILAGFARGFGFAIRIAVVSALAVSIPFLTSTEAESEVARLSAQWSASLILVGLVAGYARRISGEADRQHSLALDRLGRLADANALLFSLHRVTQTLPASLELGDVLDTTIGRLRGLFDFDVVAILVVDDTDSSLGGAPP